MKLIKIGNKLIGEGHPTFIIAEIGMNHNGDINLAKKIIKAAKDAGADAAKFQIFTAEKLVTKEAETYGNEDGHLPKYQQEMYKKYEFSREKWREIKNYCDNIGIIFFASVWDEGNADLLEELGTSVFKISGMEITNFPLLEYIAKKKLPIILSTGMSTIKEVKEGLDVIKKFNDQLILLHCIQAYPAKAEDANLLSMVSLREKFGFPIGFSDHTPDILTDTMAVALGANVLEKHFTIDKKLPGVDHHLSFDPAQMKKMVKEVRLVEKMLGSREKIVTESEKEARMMARKSVVANTIIPKGTIINKDMLAIKRPGTGLAPKEIYNIVGKKALKNIKEDELLSKDMF
jgi:N,N'-diacetyllegionaminate synthase